MILYYIMSLFHEDTSLRSNLQFFDDNNFFQHITCTLYLHSGRKWQEANQADKEHIHSYLLIFVRIQTNISDMEVVHRLYTLWLWAKSLIFNMNTAFICIMDSVTVFLSMFWANLYTYIYHFHYPFLKTKPTVYTCTAKHPITDSLLLDVCHQYATPVLKCYKFHSHQIWPKSSSLR